ncbi:phosphoglycerate mutase family protein [Patescibacteria group bacterium]|nr:phosphoglycerate mutase family protein [Patescibacteria group bacterium]MBU1868804.1 phosphoglycerate mutase family protein [Patescibacteria group bacterium]
MAKIYYITHPKVKIDPEKFDKDWEISEEGQDQLQKLLGKDWVSQISIIYSSNERKAADSARMMAEKCCIAHKILDDLCGADRTGGREKHGFLTNAEFKKAADDFYKYPSKSSIEWEKASDAQERNILALEKIINENPPDSNIAIWGHGDAGILLLCHLLGKKISRDYDQPQMGSYFVYDSSTGKIDQLWQPID